MACFEIRSLTFSYPDTELPALSQVSLKVDAGAFVTLAGTSGCGKSTLLRQLKTPLTPHGVRSGEIIFEGKPLESVDLRTQTSRIGFVMQDPESQIVTDKVWHELAFGLESLGCDTLSIRRRVAEMASYFGIVSWFHKDVRELSGGQKQLLNLAAVMAMQPSVLILDEPTAQLDPVAATNFLETVSRINRELGTTVLLTEHRLEEVLPMSDVVHIMDAGRIVCSGTPEEVGETLRGMHHGMFLAMPAPMRVFASVPAFGNCPVTVREGRAWLDAYQKARGLGPVPQEKIPPHQEGVPALMLDNVWFRYEREQPDVLRGFSFQAYPGEFVAILGGNGAGKSTALSIAAGLRRPYRGHVRLYGVDLEKTKNPYSGLLGVLPQDPRTLFVKKTVREDLQEMLDRDCNQEAKLQEVAARCRIEPLLDRHPYDLSGGEQQRAALAKILLLSPKILLLDEPTKGLDSPFKAEFAEILAGLLEDGVCVVMVSHDLTFCARYAHRCVMVFDGMIASEGTPRAFFSGNRFYTTAANRMARFLLPDAVTVEDIIAACGGKEMVKSASCTIESRTVSKENELPDRDNRNTQTDVAMRELRSYRASILGKLAVLGVLILLIPLTIYLGIALFGNRKYTVISILIILEAMLPFALLFERRKPQARELVIVAVLCAVGVAGRTVFAVLPGFSPVMAVVILSGIALGGETGFLVGAVTMFVSNFFFGQGPWTPWQMFAMGLIGFLAGILFTRRRIFRKKWQFCVFGASAALVVYGGIMNPVSVILYQPNPTWEMIIVSYFTGFPVDTAQAVATVCFLWLFATPFLEKIERIREKYGLVV